METKTPTTVGTGAGVYQCEKEVHKDSQIQRITQQCKEVLYAISLLSTKIDKI